MCWYCIYVSKEIPHCEKNIHILLGLTLSYLQQTFHDADKCHTSSTGITWNVTNNSNNFKHIYVDFSGDGQKKYLGKWK